MNYVFLETSCIYVIAKSINYILILVVIYGAIRISYRFHKLPGNEEYLKLYKYNGFAFVPLFALPCCINNIYSKIINFIVAFSIVLVVVYSIIGRIRVYEDYIIDAYGNKYPSEIISYKILSGNSKYYISLYKNNKQLFMLKLPQKRKAEGINFMQKNYKKKIPDNIENQN